MDICAKNMTKVRENGTSWHTVAHCGTVLLFIIDSPGNKS